LRCLPDTIVDLSQLKTLQLSFCKKLENLPVEFGRLRNLVELDLFYCSKLRCLPNIVMHLSQLKTLRLFGCKKLENLLVEFRRL
jgi:Leucine-rich repeat (LRR) protein